MRDSFPTFSSVRFFFRRKWPKKRTRRTLFCGKKSLWHFHESFWAFKKMLKHFLPHFVPFFWHAVRWFFFSWIHPQCFIFRLLIWIFFLVQSLSARFNRSSFFISCGKSMFGSQFRNFQFSKFLGSSVPPPAEGRVASAVLGALESKIFELIF